MTGIARPAARVRRGFRRVAIAIFIILIPIAVHALWDYIEVRRLIRVVAAIRDRGEPVTERDLSPDQPVTDEQKRAARFYSAAASLAYESYGDDRDLLNSVREAEPRLRVDAGLRADLIRRLEANLREYSDALAMLDKATPLDFRAFYPGTDHNYRTWSYWMLGRLNSIRTTRLSLTGGADEAADSVVASLRLRRVVRTRGWRQPDVADVSFILSHCAPSAEALARVQRAFEGTEEPDALVRDLMADRALQIQGVWRGYYGIDARAPEQFNFQSRSLGETMIRPWMTNRLVRDLRIRAEVIEAARRPWPERKEAFAAIVERLRTSQPTRFGDRVLLPGGLLAASVTDGSGQSGRALTLHRASRTAVAVERYRRDHNGALPATLSELAPNYLTEVPADPFTGSPLLYKSVSAEYVIYGVGHDGTDNNGDIQLGPPRWPQGRPTESPDAGIRVRVQ